MSYFEGLSCPVCVKSFTHEDDIVVCPQCGLPHHRACWKSVGHCYEEAKHGTDQQWKRDGSVSDAQASPAPSATSDANICPKCQTENAKYAEFCSRCGYELNADDWHSRASQTPPAQEYAPFHSTFAEHVNYVPVEKMDGIATEDIANVVGINTNYYIPRFRRMDQGGSGGWNWAAFLLSPYWLFYRKQYGLGAIYFSILMVIKVASAFIPVDLNDPTILLLNYALIGIWLGLSLILGIKGNAIYFAHCKKKVRSAKEKIPDLTSIELGSRGGVSAGMAVLFVALEEIGGLLIATFLSCFL